MNDVGNNNQTVDQSNDVLCKYAAYISIIVNIGTLYEEKEKGVCKVLFA